MSPVPKFGKYTPNLGDYWCRHPELSFILSGHYLNKPDKVLNSNYAPYCVI